MTNTTFPDNTNFQSKEIGVLEIIREIRSTIEAKSKELSDGFCQILFPGEWPSNGWSRFILYPYGIGNSSYCLALSSHTSIDHNFTVHMINGTDRIIFTQSDLDTDHFVREVEKLYIIAKLSEPPILLLATSPATEESWEDVPQSPTNLIEYLEAHIPFEYIKKNMKAGDYEYKIPSSNYKDRTLTVGFQEFQHFVILDALKDSSYNLEHDISSSSHDVADENDDIKRGYGTWFMCELIRYCSMHQKTIRIQKVNSPDRWERYQLLTRHLHGGVCELYADTTHLEQISTHILNMLEYHSKKLTDTLL